MTPRKQPKPKPIPDSKALYEIAVRALARRARSTGELRALLQRRKADAQDVDAVLARLREHGYLDDARFARSFVAARIDNERQGSHRVRRDLAARRVHPELVQQAVRAGYEGVDEQKLLRDYLRRKLRLTRPPEKPSAIASLYRRLLHAGFASDTIVKELRSLLRGGSFRGGATIDPEKWQEWVESLSDLPEPEEGS
jgi:regulatory protein